MIKQVVIIAFACLTGSTTSGAFTKPSYPCWITKRHREHSCQRHLSYTVHSSFKLSPSVQSYASPSNRRNAHSAGRSYPADLDTAYEWLATDRFSKDPINHVEIRWFPPSDIGTRKTFRIEADFAIPEKLEKMPLYPLGCVHAPYSQGNYTLINIEERNVKMAKDLLKNQWPNSLFCVSLQARDSGKIASVATVMQALDIEDRSVTGRGKDMPVLYRVVVTCRAVGVADIYSIDNPYVWEDDYSGNEYLVSDVRVRPAPSITNSNSIDCKGNDYRSKTNDGISDAKDKVDFSSITRQLISDYQRIRDIYSNSYSIASNELPPYARKAVETMPDFNEADIGDEKKFWVFIETWQMLCNTIRQAKRSQLASTVNELSVEVAMQFDGPLQLPVKRSSLPESIQLQLQELEQNASRDFMEMGVDPVLDFQQLISMANHWDRVVKMSWMISNELVRLEAKESLMRAFLENDVGDDIDKSGFS